MRYAIETGQKKIAILGNMFAQSQHMFCLVLGFVLHNLANLSTKSHPSLVCPVSEFGLPSLSFSTT